MKKIIIMASMLISMSIANATTTPSVDGKSPITLKDNRDFLFNKRISDYFDVNKQDKEDIDYMHNEFCNKMLGIANITDSIQKERCIKNSISFELNTMKTILDKYNYKKFLNIFNITLLNHGFGETIAHYAEKN